MKSRVSVMESTNLKDNLHYLKDFFRAVAFEPSVEEEREDQAVEDV